MKSNRFIRYLLGCLVLACCFGEAKSQEELSVDTVLVNKIYEYGKKGYENIQYQINLDSAEYYLLKAIELQNTTRNYDIDFRVAINHNSLASVYRTIYSNSKALKHYNKAEEILKKTNPDHRLLAHVYHNKGNLYKARNDLYRTKEYYEYALDFMIRHGYQNYSDFSLAFSNYVNLLFELEEYELAEEQLFTIENRNLEVSPRIAFRIHITIAISYSRLEKYDLAKSHFEKARKLVQHQIDYKESTAYALRYFYNIIDFHYLYEEYDQALHECDKAFSYIESLDPRSTKSKTIFYSDILYRAADIYYRLGNLDKSSDLANRGIEKLNVFLAEFSTGEENAVERNEFTTAIPNLYILRSRILLEKYRRTASLEHLTSAFMSYHLAIEKLNHLKLTMSNESSKLYATSQILEVYYEAIFAGIQLFKITNEAKYLEQSFRFTENSKSFALFSEIKEIEAMEFSDLPQQIRENEERYIGEIQAYEEWLYTERLKSDPDTQKIEFYKEQLFHLKDDYNDLKQEIEESNSQYYELKYNPEFVSLKEVQKELPYRDALIEYVLTDTMLITYVIDRKGINVFSQNIGPEFENECIEYYQLLDKQNFSNNVHNNYRRFVTLGRKFYNTLVEPCLRFTDKKNITIVPDGAITYLPFEGFITEDTDTEYINYLDLPYMIREFSIGYSHSSTLMFSERLKTKSPERKVLAFAPEYKDPLEDVPPGSVRQPLDTDVLLPLDGIIKEVQSINETVPSRVFLHEKATEASFKKYASDYNILHLAMHTIMRDDEPLYSHLAFTNMDTGDTIEDNNLYAYEIYNMKLNAQMAVLSSCSSGFGKMHKGEGMMSLARGFIYAGCPSIIMTLWQVSDQSSSELMTSFYRYLKKGKSKQESMRLAKIDFLDSADDLTSNPYFWSGFVVVGDSSPVYRKSGFAYWMIVVTIFIGLLIFIQYRRS